MERGTAGKTRSGYPAATVRLRGAGESGVFDRSRVADNLFWLGRYSERLEATLRLLRCVLSRLTDEASGESGAELDALIEIFALTERLPKQLAGRVTAAEIEQEILQLVYNPQRL